MAYNKHKIHVGNEFHRSDQSHMGQYIKYNYIVDKSV